MPSRPVPARPPSYRVLVPVLLLALLLAQVLLEPRRAAAAPPAPGLLAPVVGPLGAPGGTLAVAVAGLVPVAPGLTGPGATGGRLVLRTADNGPAAARPLPTASLVKLFLAEDLLHRARAGTVTLGERDRRLLQDMISASNDPAASQFWDRFGGPQMVRDVAARYGLRDTAPPDDPSQWGETTTTARDLARFLGTLRQVADPEDAATLLSWMSATTPVAADGFDQRFGVFGTAPPATAVKQGWMCCLSGQRHLHSVGVVGNRVVVLLSEVPRSVSYGRARAALDGAAAALLSPPPG
ncbi:serine hydrolase [Geodermatophilus telluris]|uniref:serine hydrolase n=1 Tax=Geodermatophilus telluris TaxID=1190417 RepID=UPI000B83A247|nr:serine hydrolase [Geodermatophilus telluris]